MTLDTELDHLSENELERICMSYHLSNAPNRKQDVQLCRMRKAFTSGAETNTAVLEIKVSHSHQAIEKCIGSLKRVYGREKKSSSPYLEKNRDFFRERQTTTPKLNTH